MFRELIVVSNFVIFFILGICSTSSAVEEPFLKLYFVPFSIETYLPITRETLEQSDPIVFMQEHKFISDLLTLLQSHPTGDKAKIEKFRHPRLKAVFGKHGAVYFVGQAGTAIREQDGMLFKINKREMDMLEKQIEYFKGVADMNAAKRYTGK